MKQVIYTMSIISFVICIFIGINHILNYPMNECKSTIPTEAQFSTVDHHCTCINCSWNGTWIPEMTMEQYSYNLDHMDTDLPEEQPMVGDTIGLYNPTDDLIIVINAGYKNGPRDDRFDFYVLTN